MTTPTHQPSGNDPLDAILAAYLEARERGEAPGVDALIAANPGHAEALRAYFDDEAGFVGAAAPFLAPGQASRPPGDSLSVSDAARADSDAVTTDTVLHRAPDPMPGEFVRYFGDYELVQEIARGGMGVVYEAKQISLNRAVALKMILAGAFASEAEVRRFHQEAEAAASLDHPHIVPIHEVGQYKGRHYFTMKLIEGGPLSEHLGRLKGDLRGAAAMTAKVARAVHFAHQRGILHRDLKPANVLLDAKDEPHVTDFGLAKRVGAEAPGLTLTGPGGVVGTPAYMPPEQARGEKNLTTAADIYSLGAILYAQLTGQPPFRAKTPLDTLRKLMDEEPAPPRSLNARVPADLETICLKCLEKEPAKRYASAQELAAELDRWLRHEPILARPVSTLERVAKWVRRHPAAAMAAAAMLALSVALALAGFTAWRNAEQRAAAVQDLGTARAQLTGIQAQVAEKAALLEAKQRELKASQETLTRSRSELAQSQKNLASVSDSIKFARESLLDSNARLYFEQARAARMAGVSGWRDAAIHSLKEAEALRARQRTTPQTQSVHVEGGAKLPERGELRSEAAAALMQRDARVVGELTTMPGFGAIAGFSADGRTVVSPWIGVSNFNELTGINPSKPPPGGLRVLDTVEGKEVGRFGDLTMLSMFAGGSTLRADGRQYANMMRDDVRLWSLPDGKPAGALQTPKGPDGKPLIAFALAYRPDGKELAGYCSGQGDQEQDCHIVVWALPDPKPHTRLTFKGIRTLQRTLEYSRAGDRLLVSLSEKELALMDPREGRYFQKVALPQAMKGLATLAPHAVLVHALLVSSGGGDALGRSGAEHVLWNLESNQLHARLSTLSAGAVMSGAAGFSPDGHQVAVGENEDSIGIYHVLSGRLLWRLRNAHRGIQRIQWTPDGEHLVVAGFDGLLRRWALSPQPPIDTIMPLINIVSVAASRDGRWLAAVESLTHDQNATHLIDRRDGSVRMLQGGTPAFSPDGRFIAFTRFFPKVTLASYDLTDLKRVAHYEKDQKDSDLMSLTSPGFTADGRLLAVRLQKGANILQVWDVAADKVLATIPNGKGSYASVTFVGDGRTFLRTLTEGEAVRIQAWDWIDGKEVTSLALPRDAMPVGMKMSRDRKTLLALCLTIDMAGAARTGTAAVGGAQVHALLHRPGVAGTPWKLPVAGMVSGFDLSPDGATAAILELGGLLRLFDTTTGERLAEFRLPVEANTQIEFSPDGKGLYYVEAKSPLRMLKLADLRRELATLGLDW